jgi:hypothetical protein
MKNKGINMSLKTDIQATIELKRIIKECKGDLEDLHVEMDEYLCKLLVDLGYEDMVEVFEEQEKWYA